MPSPDVCLGITVRSTRLATIEPVPDQPILSVVLPVHNVASYLPDMLASLRRNAHPDFEFVVVDDGSTDATPQIIEQAREALPQLQVLRHDRALGPSAARNAGLALTAGRYLTFLDGDDWIAPGHLEQLVAAIDGLGCDFVRTDHVQVSGQQRVVSLAPEARRNQVLDPRDNLLPFFRRNMLDWPYSWSGIYRRELYDLLQFDPRLHTAEDRPWIWRLHLEAASYAVVPLTGVFYRRLVTTSLTQIGDARQLHFLDAFELIFAMLADEPDLRMKAIRQLIAVLTHHLRKEARFTPALRRTVRRRGRDLLATLPPDQLRLGLPSDDRVQQLRPLLPPEVRKTVPVSLRSALGLVDRSAS